MTECRKGEKVARSSATGLVSIQLMQNEASCNSLLLDMYQADDCFTRTKRNVRLFKYSKFAEAKLGR